MRPLLLGCVALGLAGCPRVGRATFRFDLRTLHGSLTVEGIGTDDPSAADTDYDTVVNDYVLGDGLAQDHPGWRLGDRRLYEQDGRLDGVAEFGFADPAAAGLYRFDKKSAWLWCAEVWGSPQLALGHEVVATSGEVAGPYANCVAFDRRAKTLVVTVAEGGEFTSLLPQFRASGGHVDSRSGGASPPPGALGALLPDVAVPSAWASLGLPEPGGKVVYAADDALQVSHPGRAAEVLPSYEATLGAAGFTLLDRGDESSRWTRGGEVLSLSATQAGAAVIVALSRAAAP